MTIIVFSEHTVKRTIASTSGKSVLCFGYGNVQILFLLMIRSVLCLS
jgi:hypothetical protein